MQEYPCTYEHTPSPDASIMAWGSEVEWCGRRGYVGGGGSDSGTDARVGWGMEERRGREGGPYAPEPNAPYLTHNSLQNADRVFNGPQPPSSFDFCSTDSTEGTCFVSPCCFLTHSQCPGMHDPNAFSSTLGL